MFSIKDCALIAIATGHRAVTLQEFRDCLAHIEESSIYYHFWGGLLQPRFEEREYNNDFSAWVRHGLHDAVLAERLAVVDPMAFPDLETLRRELLELIETRADEAEHLAWVRATRQFEFIRSQIVVFDTDHRLEQPDQLSQLVTALSTGSVFYHFIDARRRTPDAADDFSLWLAGLGSAYDPLRERLASVDPYFGNLTELRRQLTEVFAAYFQGTSS